MSSTFARLREKLRVMTMSRKLLIENEQIVTSMRTHIKVLFIPFLILTATSAAAGFLYAATGDAAGGTVGWIVLAIAAAVIAVGVLVPFIRWLTWTFTCLLYT